MPLNAGVHRIGKLAGVLCLALFALPPAAPAADPPGNGACLEPQEAGFPLSHRLEVLSWNIQKADNPGWDADLADLGSGVNLAFIQEAAAGAGIADLLAPVLHEVFAEGYSSSGRRTGVMTLSAGQPQISCNFTTMEPWLGTPKASTVTRYPLQGRDDHLLAINLHAVNFAFGLRELQDQFAALRDALAEHAGPVILAGDLNTWSESRQVLVDQFMSEHELQPVSFEPDLRTRVFGRALDHIYVRGLQALSSQVIPVQSSDHNPLRVTLEVM